MDDLNVLILATLETKSRETEYFQKCLSDHDVQSSVVDISLDTEGAVLSGAEKLSVMTDTVDRALAVVAGALEGNVQAVVGLGGGTGGEIALRVLRGLPITFPKALITTLPFDPRIAVADSSIVLIPTLADICGLNATLRVIFENAAAMTAGICAARRRKDACLDEKSVGITGLGATDAAVSSLVGQLALQGKETTVFHSNGYGGAAFSRFAERGAFSAIVDLTPHEITRLHVAGAHVAMPERFSAGGDLPRVLLPGATNFVGLGEKSLVPPEYLERPHYEHSGYFTHAKLTNSEMAMVAELLADALNAVSGPAALLVPMGGFSHQDRPGGAIEDPELREVFLEKASARLNPSVKLVTTENHIAAPEVTEMTTSILGELSKGVT